MARRKAKKTVKQADKKIDDKNNNNEKPQINMNFEAFDKEVDQQIAAIRAVRDVQINHARTAIRSLKSNLGEKQLGTPVLQFFTENLPNLLIAKDEENGQFEVKWKDVDGNMNFVDERNVHASLLQRLSLGYRDISAFSGYGFSSAGAARTGLFGADNLQFKDFVFDGSSNSQMPEPFHTPGVNSHRLSVGMTPKTLRHPKPGELLLSVHGSPLGPYKKEEDMGAIQESEES